MSGIILADPQAAAPNRFWQGIIALLAVAGFLACGIQLGLQAAYADRVYPGVSVSGLAVGNMTRLEAKRALQRHIKSYNIEARVSGRTYRIVARDLGVRYDLGATVATAYLVGRDNAFVPLGMQESEKGGDKLNYAYELSTTARESFVKRVVAETGQAPIDATIIVNNGNPEIQPDKNGLALNPHSFARQLEEVIAAGKSGVVIASPTVQVAKVRAGDVKPGIEESKRIISLPIVLAYEGKNFTPTPAEIGKWLTFSPTVADDKPGVSVGVDSSKVKEYVLRIATKINQSPKNHKVRIENGVTRDEQVGQDGVVVNDGPVTQALVDAVSKRSPLVGYAIGVKPVPFKTEYNRVVTLDYGRYIEINLSRQRLWVYEDRKVIYESPITSGATGSGFPTVQGLFSIYNKQTNRSLNGYAIGYNYNVFVKYWMPFSGNFGMHDASWRSNFGGSDYYYGGSHGCVNMPEATAAFIYGWASVGTPVWVHS